ncbi:hypothetical protein lerEdw1_010091 [Lerista edwardsae]|nr:hypothetical protein lerEdw1_010091 [Lerista edwardsae]
MKSLLSLVVLSLLLAFCHGFCFRVLPKQELVNGEVVLPDGCIDIYDQVKHPLESTWDTAHCMSCSCSRHGMECCLRYGELCSGTHNSN